MTIVKTACGTAIIASCLVLLIQLDFVGGPAMKADYKIVLLQMQFNLKRFDQEGIPSEEILDFVKTGKLQGNITPYLIKRMSMVDVWGNRYHAKILNSGKVGFYSLGRDKVSSTEGDDPDDISSWNGAGSTYLHEEAMARNKQYLEVAVSGFVLLISISWLGFRGWPKRARQR